MNIENEEQFNETGLCRRHSRICFQPSLRKADFYKMNQKSILNHFDSTKTQSVNNYTYK